MHANHLTLIFVSSVLFNCTGDDDAPRTRLSGQAVYRDASTNHDGTAKVAATPPPQSARVSIMVRGTADVPEVDPSCAFDPPGAFEARYLSALSVQDRDAYTAIVANGSGQLQTPSGCTIPDLTIGAITDVVVRGELAIDAPNCSSFCEARARADAEAQCGATASAASCRAQHEAQATARCQTTCTTQAHAIVAEVSLAASLLGDLDADALRAAALGELTANLMFDHLEDVAGDDL